MCRPSITHTAFILASVLDAGLTVHTEPLSRAGRTLANGGTAKYNETAEGTLIAALNKERKRASVWVEEAMSSGLLDDGVTREDAEAMADAQSLMAIAAADRTRLEQYKQQLEAYQAQQKLMAEQQDLPAV